jgi:hypothetical protein
MKTRRICLSKFQQEKTFGSLDEREEENFHIETKHN